MSSLYAFKKEPIDVGSLNVLPKGNQIPLEQNGYTLVGSYGSIGIKDIRKYKKNMERDLSLKYLQDDKDGQIPYHLASRNQ